MIGEEKKMADDDSKTSVLTQDDSEMDVTTDPAAPGASLHSRSVSASADSLSVVESDGNGDDDGEDDVTEREERELLEESDRHHSGDGYESMGTYQVVDDMDAPREEASATLTTPATSATSSAGLLKPGIQYLDGATSQWPKVPSWKPSRTSKKIGARWEEAVKEGRKVGSDRPVQLGGKIGEKVNGKRLPYFHWDYQGQVDIIKAYALNDMRCPVLGCEPIDDEDPLSPAMTFCTEGFRDQAGNFYGIGLTPGLGAGVKDNDIYMRVEGMFQHWWAFHMQTGLCITLPCTADEKEKEAKCAQFHCSSGEHLYRHLWGNHQQWMKKDLKLGKKVKLQKRRIMEKYVDPCLKKWNEIITPKSKKSTFPMKQIEFGEVLRKHWTPTGQVILSHYQKRLLIRGISRFCNLAPAHMATKVYPVDCELSRKQRIDLYEADRDAPYAKSSGPRSSPRERKGSGVGKQSGSGKVQQQQQQQQPGYRQEKRKYSHSTGSSYYYPQDGKQAYYKQQEKRP